MRRWSLRVLIVLVISILAETFGIDFSNTFFNTLFTVLGIMFSVAFSQVIAFSFADVQNEDFVKQHRMQLTKIQNTFIVLFALSTLIFIFSSKIDCTVSLGFIRLTLNSIFGCFDVFFLLYFVINFIGLANLKNEIDDLIRKAKKD